MSGARMFAVDISNNQIYNEKSASSNKSDACIESKHESVNKSIHEKEIEEEDCSVYEVKSDDNEANQNEEIFGLVENESKNSENIKTIAIFIILFSILIFTAAIWCLLVFNLSSTIAAYCIILLAVIVVLDIFVIRNIFWFLISLILWCRKRKEEKKLQKYLEIVIKKYWSEKWNSKIPLGGLDFKTKHKLKPYLESDGNFVDGERESARDFERETGKDQSVFQYDETNQIKCYYE